MDTRAPARKLLVEGGEDLRVIPELMEANGIKWDINPKNPVVLIEPVGGISEIAQPGLIETELKASGLEALGIVADADDDLDGRWQQLRNRCIGPYPTIPNEIPSTGLIVESNTMPRLGIWLMPDNRSRGMLETFLLFLIPDGNDTLMKHAAESRDRAKSLGASFREAHADKALVHTWLAWRDPPGSQLHEAIFEHNLRADAPNAEPFVRWFRTLFQL